MSLNFMITEMSLKITTLEEKKKESLEEIKHKIL